LREETIGFTRVELITALAGFCGERRKLFARALRVQREINFAGGQIRFPCGKFEIELFEVGGLALEFVVTACEGLLAGGLAGCSLDSESLILNRE